MSASRLSFFLILGSLYALYQIYDRRVDPADFAVSHRRKINADSTKLFDFILLTHVLEKWFPKNTRLKSADARIMGVGKYFRIFFDMPLIGEWNAYMMTTDYRPGKLFAIESSDGFLNPRLELRTSDYHDRTILQATMCFQKPSALFHYTIGAVLRFVIKSRFEEAMIFVEEVYKATDKYRELT